MHDYRACFDFEIEFSNGGGIQGQEFRLDIETDDIDERELAAYIIKDLNLLMVGDIKILNKSIIQEPHKKKKFTKYDPKIPSFVDLSHTIKDGMITYKGLPAPIICDHFSHFESRKYYADGTEFQIGKMELVANTGTYLDTPYHRFKNGDDLSKVKLNNMSDLPGVVVRLRGHERSQIDWSSLAPYDIQGKAVLIETGWSDHWETDSYFENHPYLTAAAATYLQSHGAVLVGIDSYNIDDTSGGERPVHSVLLEAGIPIVEHLTNLSAIQMADFRFWAVPPKIEKMGTFPVRAHARMVQD